MNRLALTAVAIALVAAQSALVAGEESIRLADGAGREITTASCAMCHSLDYIPMNAPVMNRAGWQRAIQKMVDRFGAPIDDSAAREVLDYLSAHYAAGETARP